MNRDLKTWPYEPPVMYLQHSATSAGPGIPMTPADLVALGETTGSRLRVAIRVKPTGLTRAEEHESAERKELPF